MPSRELETQGRGITMDKRPWPLQERRGELNRPVRSNDKNPILIQKRLGRCRSLLLRPFEFQFGFSKGISVGIYIVAGANVSGPFNATLLQRQTVFYLKKTIFYPK
jgi:hypothetical protein